ncbi:hypothetical protein E5S70_07225 [Ensifer adhaerens]|uniref:hypothetical protein n=1 Tax=Ensifer canadensis TaxID=555315 RepID=UPI0014901003|nr:hypothetical protein [Ensifer canadensis]NOV15878.1 hypothetical protein [Ensifer canadensis]
MAEAQLKVGIRFRWWVKPMAYAAIVPALLIELCLGGSRGEAFVASVGRFVTKHGVVFEMN